MKEKGLWAGSGRTAGTLQGKGVQERKQEVLCFQAQMNDSSARWPYLGTLKNLRGCQFWSSCISL